MIKEIKVDKDNKFEINTAFGWLYKYKEYFGEDILPALVPMIDSAVGVVASAVDEDRADVRDIVAEAMGAFAGTESTTVTNIIWALAKNADPNIPRADEWFNKFERFPVDRIIPEIFWTLAESYATTKKVEGLKARIKSAEEKADGLRPTK